MDHLQRSSAGAPWDEVFGGGVVDGAVTLLTGDPGTGKTMMLLQIAAGLAEDRRRNVLYVLRGQTPLALRATMERCGIPQGRISVATGLDDGLVARIGTFAAVILDPAEAEEKFTEGRLPVVYAGTLAEIRNVCKETGTPLFIVRNLEKETELRREDLHIADVCAEILYVDDDGVGRLLRIMKNRYGAVTDLPLAMTAEGLEAAPPKRWYAQLVSWFRWAFHGRWR